MLPTALSIFFNQLQQEQPELAPDIGALRLADRKSVSSDRIVKMVVVQDSLGRLQVLFPAHCLIDIDTMNGQLGRELVILPNAELAKLQQRHDMSELPAIPGLTGLPAVLDERLQQVSEVYLELGLADQLLHLSGPLFQALTKLARPLKYAVPIRSIDINRDDPAQDLEQINRAISQFTRLRIQQRLQDTLELPPLPETAHRVMQLRVDPDAGIAELAEIVETDPSLSAQVVSWASSSYYAAPGRIRSVYDAIMRILGFDLVMNLAMGLALGRTLKQPADAPAGFTPYWQQAVWMATTASALSTAIPREHRPEFGLCYLSGLLHSFGYLVLAHIFPPHFSLMCRYAECNQHLDPAYIEHFLLGITREQIGSKLMELWNMPDEVVVALRQQKSPFYEGEHAAYGGLLFMATQLLRQRGLVAGPALPIPAALYEQLHLDPKDAEDALQEILESADDLTSMANSLG